MMHLSENPRFQSLDEARRINIYNIINVMGSVRAYRFRLYPDAKRQREIDEQIELARFLYNKLLGLAKEEYLKDRNLQITKSTFNRLMKGIVREKGNSTDYTHRPSRTYSSGCRGRTRTSSGG